MAGTAKYQVYAFDVDNVLRKMKGRKSADRLIWSPNPDAVILLVYLAKLGNVRIVVWSDKGKVYAEKAVNKFGIRSSVWRCAEKSQLTADLCKVDVAVEQHTQNEYVENTLFLGE